MKVRFFRGAWTLPVVAAWIFLVAGSPLLAREGGGGEETGTAPAAREESLGKVVATYSLGEIREAEMERAAGIQLYQLRQQVYDTQTRAIRQLVSERLLRAEALRQGKTRDELYAERVGNLITEPSEDQVNALMQQYRSQLPEEDAEARAVVVRALKDQQKKQLEQVFQKQLLARADLKITLEPPRAPLTIEPEDPVRGPAEAPITIVEFSDFQCSFCARAQQTLHLLKLKYPGLIRVVFKNMPGARHDRARPAAEAALCAGRQGRFWEMHDWLFSHQNELDDDSITGAARDIGLDMEAFSACLESDETLGQIDRGVNTARFLGLTGTPVFFINGIMVRGARPLTTFDEIVRAELERLGVPIPETAARTTGPAGVRPEDGGPGEKAKGEKE